MTANLWKCLAASLGALVFVASASAQIITVPNSDFNDNSDGDLSLVAGWTDSDAADGEQVESVGPDGTTIMSIGDGSRFNNPTAFTGVTFDTTEPGYRLSVQARAATSIAFDDTAASESNWGILLRDATNGNNIKTLTEPNLITEDWAELELFLSQDELLQYETDAGVDVDTAEIAVRFFRNQNNTGVFVGVDNVVLEISAPPVPGDVDGNGSVGLEDYAIIRDNLLVSPATRAQGDIFPTDAGDGIVDLSDFGFWKTEFLAVGGTEAQIAAFDAAIPEPSALVLAAIGAAFAGARRR